MSSAEIIYQLISNDGHKLELKQSEFEKSEFGNKYVTNQKFMKQNLCVEIPFKFSSMVCVFFDCIPTKQLGTHENMTDFVRCLLYFNPSLVDNIKIDIGDFFGFQNNNFWFISKKLCPNSITLFVSLKTDQFAKNYEFAGLEFLEMINLIAAFTNENEMIEDLVIFIFLMFGGQHWEKYLFTYDVDKVIISSCSDSHFKIIETTFDDILYNFLESDWVNNLKDSTLTLLAATLSEINYNSPKNREKGLRAKSLFKKMLLHDVKNSLILNSYALYLSLEKVLIYDKNALIYYLSHTTFEKDNLFFFRRFFVDDKFVSLLDNNEINQICKNLLTYCKTNQCNPGIFTNFSIKPQMCKAIISELNQTEDFPTIRILTSWLSHFSF